MSERLSDFERKALECIALEFGADEAAFREQIAAALVVERENTGSGFFTKLTLDRRKCRPVELLNGRGGQFQVRGVENGLGIILWGDEADRRFLEIIEGYTFEDPFVDFDLRQIEFLRFDYPG